MNISASTCRAAVRRRARDESRTSWLLVGAALLALGACDDQAPDQSGFEELTEISFEDQLEGEAASIDVSPSPSTNELASPRAQEPRTHMLASASTRSSDEQVTHSAALRPATKNRKRVEQAEDLVPAPLAEAPETSQPLLASTSPVVQAQPPIMAPAPTPTPAPAPAPITSADFDGRFHYVGGQSQRAQVAAAIEATVDSLPLMFRSIARKRLTQANPIDATLDIRVRDGDIRTSFASGFSVSCPLDGPAVRARSTDGQKLDVRMRSQGTKLVQQIKSRSSTGAGKVVFVLSQDRRKLTVHHEVSSPRLPVPVRYSLSYVRN